MNSLSREGVGSRTAQRGTLLESSSPYLNDLRVRDWIATDMLRRNGADVSIVHNLPEIFDHMPKVQDADRINWLIANKREQWPALDAWFARRHISRFTLHDLASLPENSIGKRLYGALTEMGLTLELSDYSTPAKHDFEYWWKRYTQVHDFEHLLVGRKFDSVGEMAPDTFRIANTIKHLGPALGSELCQGLHLTVTCWLSRTMLHYPEIYIDLLSEFNRGWQLGMESGPVFLANYDDILHLSVSAVRGAVGVPAVDDQDTTRLSAFWTEKTSALGEAGQFKGAHA